MYTNEQMAKMTHENSKEIAALRESTKSAHKRLNENDAMTAGIHDLAKSVAQMATEIRLLTERMDASIERIEQGQKAQGERIGSIEKMVSSLDRNERKLADHEKRLDEIEKEPATKWKNFTWLIIAGITTAVVAFLVGKFI